MLQLQVERKRRGVTQTRLSALTGISPQDISAIENQRRVAGPGWRARIARALVADEVELFRPTQERVIQ